MDYYELQCVRDLLFARGDQSNNDPSQPMSLLRPFSALDLFKFNNINLDAWTETVRMSMLSDAKSRSELTVELIRLVLDPLTRIFYSMAFACNCSTP